MTAPIDQLRDLIAAACELSRAQSPEAHAMALTLFAMKAGNALGCSPAEVKEQLDLMRAPPPNPIRIGGVTRARGTKTESLDDVVEKVRLHLVEGGDAHG